MRINLSVIAAAALIGGLAGFPASSCQAARVFVVAVDGNDANPGTERAPFASIQRAQQAVRRLHRAGLTEDVVVSIGSGTYRLTEPLRFGPQDGGTDTYSVTYTAAQGQSVVLSGGRPITGWRPGPDGLWTAPIPPVQGRPWFFRQLYADGRRLSRSRYPAEGFLKIVGVSDDHRTLRLSAALPREPFAQQDTEVVVVQNWSISRERIVEVDGDRLTAKTPIGWVGHSQCLPKPGMSVFLEHARSFLTGAGQWFLDRESGTLYYRPAANEDPRRTEFVAPCASQLIRVEGRSSEPVRNLHVQRLILAHAGWWLPNIGYGGIQACYHGTHVDEPACFATDVAVEFRYCTGCSIRRCRLSELGGSGIGLGAACRDTRVVGCLIRDVGATGVNVGHMRIKDPLWADWDDPKKIPVRNEVANCYIHHCGRELWGAHGIFDAMTQETRIHHNEIAWIPYGGIATGFVWNTERTSQQNCRIEYNHVHDVMLKLNDSGCIYTLGFQPGSIIRGNLLHGVRFAGFAGGQICNNGIFFDEGSKGFTLEGNVIYDVDQAAGARNSAVRYNHSQHDWHTWVDNTIQTNAEPPRAAADLAERAGLQAEYRDLLNANQQQ